MMAKVCTAAVNGIEAYVEVEVNAGFGDTIIVIVVNKTPEESLGCFLEDFVKRMIRNVLLGGHKSIPTLAA